MTRRLRVLLHAQPLRGTGHFVRAYEIAREVASRHEVYVVDGARPISRPAGAGYTLLPIPRLYRQGGSLAPVEGGEFIDQVMERRRRLLSEAADELRPDILLIEHYPFSKWELAAEIISLIECARTALRRCKVVCSLRDIPPAAVDRAEPARYRQEVTQTLREHFDLLLVHADPRLIRLDEFFSWVDEVPVPVVYTGYVSEKLAERAIPREGGEVIASTGGGDGGELLCQCADAWRRLSTSGQTGGRRLTVFQPPFGKVDLPADDSIRLEPFSTSFLRRMATADLSISRAGYNTCANILETRTPAVVVPDRTMFDQLWRARRLTERGLVQAVLDDPIDVGKLAAAIAAGFSRGPVTHDLDLDGARRTREILESL